MRHPDWCAGGHHCTAPGGEHASEPEVWETSVGRMVATRYQRAGTGASRMELRVVVSLPSDEATAVRLARHVVGLTYVTVDRALGPRRG